MYRELNEQYDFSDNLRYMIGKKVTKKSVFKMFYNKVQKHIDAIFERYSIREADTVSCI